MSIWCTILDFADDDHDVDRCDRWIPCTSEQAQAAGRAAYGTDAWWLYDDTKPCTCAAGPLAYQKSHVVPTADGPRAGVFDLASIAPHIGPDCRYSEDRDVHGTHLPFLRVGLQGSEEEPGVVVLDRRQVAELHRVTGWFLEHCDPEPAAEAEARSA
jgi:hypothetical protein